MTFTIPGFDYQRVAVDGDVTLNVAVGGTGRPIVLLHGFPQTHVMWRHVALDLAADHTVICPDLRGCGASDKPDARRRHVLQAHHGRRHRHPRQRARPRALRSGRTRPRCPRRHPRRPRPSRNDHPPRHPRRPADPGHVGHPARIDRRGCLPSVPDGPATRPARADDQRQRGRVLRLLPRRMGPEPAGHSGGTASGVPESLPRGGPVHRRRLPRLGRHRHRTRPGRPSRREPTADAGHRRPAGRGNRTRLRRPRALPTWTYIDLPRPDGADGLRVTAVPAQHGPDGTDHLTGPVTGFVLHGDGLPTVYVSGDNASLRVVEEIVPRFPTIDVAILFGGAARTPLLGDANLTLDAAGMVQATRILGAPTVVPVHIDSWAHFTEGIADVRAAFTTAGLADLLQVPGPRPGS